MSVYSPYGNRGYFPQQSPYMQYPGMMPAMNYPRPNPVQFSVYQQPYPQMPQFFPIPRPPQPISFFPPPQLNALLSTQVGFTNGEGGYLNPSAKGIYGRTTAKDTNALYAKGTSVIAEQYSDSASDDKRLENLLGYAKGRLDNYDTDGDGKISVGEFTAGGIHPERFNDVDLNNDGKLDLAEYAAYHGSYDRNNDGRITFQENILSSLQFSRERVQDTLDKFDLRTKAEAFLAPPTLTDAQKDKWIDSIINLDIKEPSLAITQSDLNGDGLISKDEFKQTRPSYTNDLTDHYFNNADADGDGKVSIAEDVAYTMVLDKDKDGLYSTSEVKSGPADIKQQVKDNLTQYNLADRVKKAQEGSSDGSTDLAALLKLLGGDTGSADPLASLFKLLG